MAMYKPDLRVWLTPAEEPPGRQRGAQDTPPGAWLGWVMEAEGFSARVREPPSTRQGFG